MLFAIVDIETTGGNPLQGGITEIAALIHDGNRVIDTFHTLINPQQFIPGFITGLTGIDQEMVKDSPIFAEIASEFFDFLKDKIFVAHNVNFDYTFIKEAFRKEGYVYDVQKLCTVKLSRKAFPGYKSYSLGRLCEHLNIRIENRHRAIGDAQATAILFGKIHGQNSDVISQSLKKNSGELFLPPNISIEKYLELPESTGVYYFHDAKGKVIYVGKALDIRSRFKGHFSGTSKDKAKMDLKYEIHDISVEVTGSEFLAYLIEMLEIKRLWPKYNKSQKFKSSNWGLVSYEDASGFLRFQISKVASAINTVQQFDSHSEAWKFLMDNVETFELCPKLSGMQKSNEACFDHKIQKCKGACCGKEQPDSYNERVQLFLSTIDELSGSILIREKGRNKEEQAAMFFENGLFSGYGFISHSESISKLSEVFDVLKKVKMIPESKYILKSFLGKIPMNNIMVIKEGF
ncbi:exonuclease domain-containing protein [Rhodonellum sp.]|uniref:exonuclease domain-containing protein n=1 Tax=Rhodonellum sp. TaxID=2231180 RepID=UPI00271D1A40|nr:exonuclease domain-containing protein [Rhodonellum sp.]MDO9554916.1 exonuclease domain-containing protein [Rhodonellum sp.]